MKDSIKLGDESFAKMMFVLDRTVTQKNHRDYRYENEELVEISEGIWAMPAYMKENEDFSMFFILTQIDDGSTVIAFSTGNNQGGKFALSKPMVTGKGLNVLNEHASTRAVSVLHFINQISKADEGSWRMIAEEQN